MSRLFHHYRPVALLALAALTLALAWSAPARHARADDSGNGGVSIVDFAFTPGVLTVNAGATVTWTNTGDSVHTVTSGAPGDDDAGSLFDFGPLQSGDTASFEFDTPGTYTLFCRIHPTMTETIIVGDGTQ
ncbi:MAG TPA: cupredoxin domain-containing protein [Dehalococcoidia bacterium]|nr:cupredoxin domain-containing protein [Dehalococcoidia bacterium]